MDFLIAEHGQYSIKYPELIHTPRLLVFQERVLDNIKAMKSILESQFPKTGFQMLCPHVKTNKSSLIIKMLIRAGVSSFKTSINEAELAAKNGAQEVFVAYPLLKNDALYMADLIVKYKTIAFYVQVGCREHVDILNEVAEEKQIIWNVLIDLDVGMHRTGSDSAEAFRLYDYFKNQAVFNFSGLHGYDGQVRQLHKKDRVEASAAAMDLLLETIDEFIRNGTIIKRVIVSGSPAFMTDLEYLKLNIPAEVSFQVSPGTWIFWDSKYDQIVPETFTYAALILARIIEIKEDRLTLNLGHKRWAADQGAIEVFSFPELQVDFFSEEHTVLINTGSHQFKIGDYILIVPKHVCPTVNLYEYFTLIGLEGDILESEIPVDGRNR